MDRRQLLAGFGLGIGVAAASRAIGQTPPPSEADLTAQLRSGNLPHRRARTTKLFKSPDSFPNAVRSSPEGLWVAEQITPAGPNRPASGRSNNVYLMDLNGKVLRTLKNDCRNTSGMGYGGGSLWLANNYEPWGIMQYDVASGALLSHRQVPLGPPANGGGCHGCIYHEGKLYLTSLRMNGILRVDAKSWEPEMLIPYTWPRSHELEWDNGAIWLVTGTLNGPSPTDDRAGLAKYDAATGKLLETAWFGPEDADPHGLTIHNGMMYTCDAGIHPGWPDQQSASAGYICRIDFD